MRFQRRTRRRLPQLNQGQKVSTLAHSRYSDAQCTQATAAHTLHLLFFVICRYYLCLYAGEPTNYSVPRALDGPEDQAMEEGEQRRTALFTRKDRSRGSNLSRRADGSRPAIKSREWIQNKKERQRRQGKEVVHDSKYTGRKRRPKF